MTGIYLLLGSNLGDRRGNLAKARELLRSKAGAVGETSNLYRTAAWGTITQPAYYNQVLNLDTSYAPHHLLEMILSIEKEMGRIRNIKWGSRIIDIDILYYNQQIISDPHLALPHPQIPHRRFTLVPLCEIAPNFENPKLGKTNLELLNSCTDDLAVQRLKSKS